MMGKTIGMFNGRGGKEEPQELTAEELEQKLKQKLEKYFGRNNYAQ